MNRFDATSEPLRAVSKASPYNSGWDALAKYVAARKEEGILTKSALSSSKVCNFSAFGRLILSHKVFMLRNKMQGHALAQNLLSIDWI